MDENNRIEQFCAAADNEKILRLITDSIIDMVSLTDANLIYQFVSPSHKVILGYGPGELLGKNIFSLMHPNDIADAKNFISAKTPGRAEFRYRHARGHYIWLESTCSPLVESGQIDGYIHVRRDISSRKATEKKVKYYQEQLRSLATELMLAEQKERRRMATYLHDYIGQYLTIAKFKLDSLCEPREETDLNETLNVIGKLMEKTIGGIRALIYGISPPIFYEMDFESSIRWLAEELVEKRGIRLVFNSDIEQVKMAEETSIILLTAIRELLVNIAKHADAGLVSICIQKRCREIQVIIYDDGKGFVTSGKRPAAKNTRGYGLFSIRESLKTLGGRLAVESKPGQGTRVFLGAPLKNK